MSIALEMRVSIPNDHTKVDSAYVMQVTVTTHLRHAAVSRRQSTNQRGPKEEVGAAEKGNRAIEDVWCHQRRSDKQKIAEAFALGNVDGLALELTPVKSDFYFSASSVWFGPSPATWTRICFSRFDWGISTFIAIEGQQISRRK